MPPTVIALGVVSLLTDIATEMVYPLLPHFFLTVLAAPTVWLGWIEGIAESTATLAKLPAGIVSDRLGRRKPLILLGYGVAGLIRPLIGLTTSAWQALAVRFTDRLAKGVRGVPRDALIAESTVPEHRGRAFGFHRAMDHAGAAVGPAIAFAFLLWRPEDYRSLFLLSIVPGIAVIVVVWLFVHDSAAVAKAHASDEAARRSLQWSLSAFGPRFQWLLATIVVFSFANSSDAFLLWRLEQLGMAPGHLPLVWFALHVLKSGANVFGGRLADRFSPRILVAAGWTVYGAAYLGFGLSNSLWQAVGWFALYAAYFGLAEPAEKKMVAAMAPKELRATAFGWFNLAVGVSALPASVLFGWLADATRLGPAGAFGYSAALAAIAAGMLLPLERFRQR